MPPRHPDSLTQLLIHSITPSCSPLFTPPPSSSLPLLDAPRLFIHPTIVFPGTPALREGGRRPPPRAAQTSGLSRSTSHQVEIIPSGKWLSRVSLRSQLSDDQPESIFLAFKSDLAREWGGWGGGVGETKRKLLLVRSHASIYPALRSPPGHISHPLPSSEVGRCAAFSKNVKRARPQSQSISLSPRILRGGNSCEGFVYFRHLFYTSFHRT